MGKAKSKTKEESGSSAEGLVLFLAARGTGDAKLQVARGAIIAVEAEGKTADVNDVIRAMEASPICGPGTMEKIAIYETGVEPKPRRAIPSILDRSDSHETLRADLFAARAKIDELQGLLDTPPNHEEDLSTLREANDRLAKYALDLGGDQALIEAMTDPVVGAEAAG